MHKIHAVIFDYLRHRKVARFSELQRLTSLESDSFKFHIRHLVRTGMISKADDGGYSLTFVGKQFANSLDDTSSVVRKQAKLSMQLIISRQRPDGQTEYVCQERLRQPYMRYSGLPSGPVGWGEAAEDAARRECLKQTGLTAQFAVRTVCRVRDYDWQAGRVLEDKLFIVLQAQDISGELGNEWPHGRNAWLTLEQMMEQPKAYSSTSKVLAAARENRPYLALDMTYDAADY